MKIPPAARLAIAGVLAVAGQRGTAVANEIWIAPTYQHDLGGVGTAVQTWPVSILGQVRFAFAVPADFLRLTGATLLLVPQSAVGRADVNLVICRARDAELVGVRCATGNPVRFSGAADTLVAVDIRTELEPQLGPAGVTYMAVMATISPASKSDHFLGLRLTYDAAVPGLGANTFTGTQVIASGDLDLSGSGRILQNGGVLLHTSGTNNVFYGAGTGQTNLQGRDNTGIGTAALNRHYSGDANTAVGSAAMVNDFFGSGNTAVGFEAFAGGLSGYANVSNTAVGYRALGTLDRGHSNVAIGDQAGAGVSLGHNNIYIGAGVSGASETGTMRLGANLYRVFLSGVWGTTPGGSTTVPVVIDQFGQIGTVSSSRRYKEDIRDMADASRRLLALRPVTFRYKGKDAAIEYGLIAEEVADAFPDLVVYGTDGRPETVKYHTLNILLLNEFQAQQRRIDALERELAALRAARK